MEEYFVVLVDIFSHHQNLLKNISFNVDGFFWKYSFKLMFTHSLLMLTYSPLTFTYSWFTHTHSRNNILAILSNFVDMSILSLVYSIHYVYYKSIVKFVYFVYYMLVFFWFLWVFLFLICVLVVFYWLCDWTLIPNQVLNLRATSVDGSRVTMTRRWGTRKWLISLQLLFGMRQSQYSPSNVLKV